MWYGISCSFLVIITHSCCALVSYYHQKAYSIPYHTVNTWNEVVNPSVSSAGACRLAELFLLKWTVYSTQHAEVLSPEVAWTFVSLSLNHKAMQALISSCHLNSMLCYNKVYFSNKVSEFPREPEVATARFGLSFLDKQRIPDINEYFFFHGTTHDSVMKIISQNIDFRLSNSGLYGHGAYLAESASKSDQYCGDEPGIFGISGR